MTIPPGFETASLSNVLASDPNLYFLWATNRTPELVISTATAQLPTLVPTSRILVLPETQPAYLTLDAEGREINGRGQLLKKLPFLIVSTTLEADSMQILLKGSLSSPLSTVTVTYNATTGIWSLG